VSGFIESFKEGMAEPSGPHGYQVAGVRATCPHCGNQTFEDGGALLNTPGLTFFGLDFANREAYLLICERCGCVQWFLKEPVST